MFKRFFVIIKRIWCGWKGHTHPMLDCFRCGASAPLEFERDKYGVALRDSRDQPIYKWVGWGVFKK